MNTFRAATWKDIYRDYARDHLLAALGLSLALAAVLALLMSSLWRLWTGGLEANIGYALLGGTAGFVATALGAVPALALRQVPQRVEDSMLGLAAGMMMAASAFSLLLPALASAESLLGGKAAGAGILVVGMGLGVLLMLGLDTFTPHSHEHGEPCGPGHERCGRMGLFVLAIALHNLPEGMAVGVGFGQGELGTGLPLAIAIALQDIPEGLAVALALRAAGVTAAKAVLIAGLTGLLEPVGALMGVGLSGGLAPAYPLGLALAAGAMMFVVSHEVIPETHRNGHQTAATLGFMAGFAVMMVLDTALG